MEKPKLVYSHDWPNHMTDQGSMFSNVQKLIITTNHSSIKCPDVQMGTMESQVTQYRRNQNICKKRVARSKKDVALRNFLHATDSLATYIRYCSARQHDHIIQMKCYYKCCASSQFYNKETTTAYSINNYWKLFCTKSNSEFTLLCITC